MRPPKRKNKITQVSIKGFRSLREVEGLPLHGLNVLIGPNGSGKSNFIAFFRMLRFAMEEGFQRFVQTSGFAESLLFNGSKQTAQIEGSLLLAEDASVESRRVRYDFGLTSAAPDTLVFLRERMEVEQNGSTTYSEEFTVSGKESGLLAANQSEPPWLKIGATTLRRVLGGLRIYQFHDTSPSSGIRKTADTREIPELAGDGRNLAVVLHRLSADARPYYERIVKTIRRGVPNFRDFVLQTEGPDSAKVLLRWRGADPEYVFGPHQLSDGSLRFIALVTLLMQPPEQLPDIVIIDEPELGLHPAAEAIVAGLIRSASQHCQLVVATQSASFLDSFEPEHIIVSQIRDGATALARLAPGELDAWLSDYTLGDIWRKNLIGGRP
jgi:predicted ATPase